MKLKLALSTATALGLLMGAALAADNESDVNQLGSGGTVNVEQGGIGGHDAGVLQGADEDDTGNSVDIKQIGQNNEAGTAGSTDPASEQLIYQAGDNNAVTIEQDGVDNEVDGDQIGNGNSLVIDQSGSNGTPEDVVNNFISYSQTGDENGIPGIPAGDSSGANGNVVPPRLYSTAGDSGRWNFLQQRGTGNRLELNQANNDGGIGNGVIVRQLGTDGDMEINQTNGYNFFYSAQTGSSNEIKSSQTNDDSNVNFNLVDIEQLDSANNLVDAIQNGNKIDLFVTQNGAATIDSEVVSRQSGDSQFASVSQQGGNHYANVLQEESGNSATISQFGSNQNSDSQQTGSGNTATVFQDGLDNESDVIQGGDGNLADVMQDGSLNVSLVSQTGGLNKAFIDQIGDDHDSDVNQSGNSNTATVMQTTDNNTSAVAQAGNGNFATITQN